ncbi:MliC family protein [Mannheimia haemolytica]|uniref:Membrane-bound lysozyme-inhibitor of c-type lysozyme n=2 Tax=Mannheimia haemolytica TaxID=75985 RepID=A0A378MUI4_MANHA|nr:MliC family protein [Mannheimia haemolytica]AGK00667.1 putative opacity-associated protein OapB [Mannheimia haemolytica M42548]AGQ25524.1 opacity-associated protein B [Mannheimia haemolytica D153]AGQ41080.1 opacity-associated protein B [Mannheimia haemolytica D174]AGR75998.1 opacity-associated protein B [Mannheimia haemolytica USMARC_2286]AKA10540.1 opacity-associated protein B [Mannheimia haemolytica]
MNLFCPSYKLIYLTLSSAMLVACSTVVTPVEQIHQVQKEKESVKKVTKLIAQAPKVSLYRCENDKKVEVERQGRTKKALKKEIVTVSYQGTTHQLSPSVTRDGKKYTNIRWTWHETRSGKAFLYNNTKKTLAANCIKQ